MEIISFRGDVMSTAFGSPTDEIGSGNTTIYARTMNDIAVDVGPYWKLNRGLGSIIRLRQFLIFKPVLLTAGENVLFNTPFNLV